MSQLLSACVEEYRDWIYFSYCDYGHLSLILMLNKFKWFLVETKMWKMYRFIALNELYGHYN